MLNARNKQPIKVGILKISAQNKALLEFFFSGSGKSYFKEVSADQASCFIIDYDSLGAKESWETTFKELQKPGIIISIKAVDLPSTIWVAKPLTVKALMDASITIKEIIDAEDLLKETVIAPVEKQVAQKEIIEAVSQHEAIPLETEIDIDRRLSTPELFLDDEKTSSIIPIDKTDVGKDSKDTDDISSLLESLISEGETENSYSAELFELKPEAAHNIEETTSKTIFEDLDLKLGIVATELENNVQSSEEESKKNNGPLVNDVHVNTNKISIPKKKYELTPSKPSKKSVEDELQDLLEEIRHEADDLGSARKSQRKAYLPTMADERWKLTCGKNKKKQNLQSLCTIKSHEYILSSLLGTIKNTKETNIVSRVKFKDVIVVIDQKTNSIYCDESIFSDYYANICHAPISKNDIKIHQLDESEIRLYRKKIEAGDENSHSIESFIWTTSLVTHQGYLPTATDINKKIGLKYWPNLTRLENVPHSIQIAAIFDKCSKSLSEITNEMDIPKKYIIAFYNAALSLDFIELNERKLSSVSTSVSSKPNKNRGFFSRFLKRLSS